MRFLWALPALILWIAATSASHAEGDLTFKVQIADVDLGQTSGIHLYMETEESYPCINYVIPYELETAGDEITATLRDPVDPDICYTIVGPASLTAPLEVADGTYTLRLNYGDRSDACILAINPGEIDLTPIAPSFSMCATNIFNYVSHRSFSCRDSITPSPTLAPSPSPSSTPAPSAAPSTPGAFPATGGAPPPASSSGSALALLALTLLVGTAVAGFAAARRVP